MMEKKKKKDQLQTTPDSDISFFTLSHASILDIRRNTHTHIIGRHIFLLNTMLIIHIIRDHHCSVSHLQIDLH